MLANQISEVLSERFRIPAPPTIGVTVAGSAQVAFSRFQNLQPQGGFSVPPKRQEAFVFKIPLKHAKFSRVLIAGKEQAVLQSPGEAYLFDLTVPNEISLDATYDSVRIHLSQASLDAISYDRGITRVERLTSNSFGQSDPILYGLAMAVLPAIENPQCASTAFVEHVTLAFHEHVIRTYGQARKGGRTVGGLAPWQIKRSLEFIEANLADDPSIAALSAECGMSESYFARAFRISIGMPPHRWIIGRRVRRAKMLLAEAEFGLAEIALICGFVDQSHLGRVFIKAVGCTPAEWRRRKGG